MSVQPGPTFKRYAANGVATVYAIPFLLLDAADLQITLNGTLVTTGFTLSGVGNPTSSCAFAVAPTGDLLFQQLVPFQRLADYQINGDFLAQTVNRDFDRLWLAIKQLNRDSNRALTVSLLEPEGIPSLPAKATRALKMLAFDASGNPTTSNLTLAQLEQQPELSLEAAQAAAASAAQALASQNAAHASELAAAVSAAAALAAQQVTEALAGDPWAVQPIGVPIPVWEHMLTSLAPPTNKFYRYIKLTASDSYNTGILTSQSVTGSEPLLLATAVISLAGSPLNGKTVSLINSERRVLRAAEASGELLFDALQGHGHEQAVGEDGVNANSPNTVNTYDAGLTSGGTSIRRTTSGASLNQIVVRGPITLSGSGTVRFGGETRAKSISATYYLRIK